MKKFKSSINKMLSHQLAIGLIILNITLLILYTPPHYLFELMQSMAVQLFLVLIGLGLLFAVFKKWIGVGTTLIALVLLMQELPLQDKSIVKNINGTQFSVAHFNVYKHNNNHRKLISKAIATNADFLSFNEVTPVWGSALSLGLSTTYPFSYMLHLEGSFGLAIYSKTALGEMEETWYKDIPILSGYFTFDNTQINFVSAHTIPPTTKDSYALRNQQLDVIQGLLNNQTGPKLLVGDLNTVSWAEPLKELRKRTGLMDSRNSLAPTYPSWNKFARIPIDHLLYSKEIQHKSFQTIYVEGSDHLGIKGSFILTEKIAGL